MRSSRLESRWNAIVSNNSIYLKDGKEYLTMQGVNSLHHLFVEDYKTRSLERSPELIAEEVEEWKNVTKGMIESLLVIVDVMDETQKAILQKTLAEYQAELHK